MTNRIWDLMQEASTQPGPSGPQLTEPGDPDFSPSTGSQGQVPAAAAQSRQFDNMRRAENQIQQAIEMGYDVDSADWAPVHEQAETGFAEPEQGVIGSLVGWIDGPRQAINMLIQDIAGGEAEEGMRNPNFGDYWNTMWGGLEDQEGFQLETGLNPISGSETLDMFGWSEAGDEDTVGRIVRGVADFGLQVAMDPLTYVTFGLSGLGKKVALSTGQAMQKAVTRRVLQAAQGKALKGATGTVGKSKKKILGFVDDPLTKYEQNLMHNLDDITTEFQDELLEKAGQWGGELPPEMQDALSRYFGRSEDVWENITEAALANRIHKDVIRPLVGRDFANIDSLAMDLLPAYAKGGARISVPFTRNTLADGVVIPGTQGLGRKMVGNPMRRLQTQLRKVGPYGKMADAVSKGVTKIDQMAPLLRGLKNGDIEGWQWHVAATAIENMHNNVARHTISTELNSQWNHISQLAKNSDTDLNTIGADILLNLEGDNVSDVILEQLGRQSLGEGQMGYRALNPQLASSVDETITYMQQVMDSYHTALGALDPDFADKFIRGYIPHSPTKEARQIMTQLAGTKAGTTGRGDTAVDLFAQILNAQGYGGAAEANMGTVRNVGRQVGKVSTLTDDGTVNIHKDALLELGETQPRIIDPSGAVNPNAVETRYMPTPQLNDLLEPIVRRMAKEQGITLPKNWDGKLFNENPMETMLDYVGNMTDAINAWQTVDSLTASGLAFRHQTELDVQQVIQNIMNNAVENTRMIETTRFGKPRQGETESATTQWLKKAINPKDYDNAVDDLAGQPRRHEMPDIGDAPEGMPAPPAEKPKDYTGFVDDIGERGVQEPVIVEVLEDGRAIVANGHHRIAAADQAGVADMPIQVRRGSAADWDEGVGEDVSHWINDEWLREAGGPASLRYTADDIVNNPEGYAYHSTERTTDLDRQLKFGGLYADIEEARRFVRHPGEEGAEAAIEPGTRRVLVFDRADLPPSILNPLERNGEIGDIRGANNVRPIGSFDPALGPESFEPAERLAREGAEAAAESPTQDVYEAFDMMPWMPEVKQELSLLHGPGKGRIAGVSESVLVSVDDSKVIKWNSIDDVADTRRVAQKVNASHYTDWAEDVPTPDVAQSTPPDTRSFVWETHTDANSIRHEAFSPEELGEAGKRRAQALREADKAKAAKRAADKRAKGEPPRLRVQARKADHPQGAVLKLMPYEQLNRQEQSNVWRAAHEWLDRAFQEGGTFEGQFTDAGIQNIIDSGLDDYTAEVLHSYVHTKLGSLGRDAVEFISKEPSEVFETRRLFDDWVRGIDEFVRGAAAVRTADGKLIADPEKIRVAGTKEVREQLAGLKRAALKLGDRGYDEAVDVMQDVEAYTGVASLDGYVQPSLFNLGGPAVENLTLERNVAEWMSLTAKNMGTIYTPEGIAAAKMATNQTLKWWRAMATLPRPAFHIRNTVGGSWMNMNFGVKTHTMAKAAQHGIAFRKALSSVSGSEGLEQAFERLPKEMQNAWRAAWDHNVLAGFATTEFSAAVTPTGARKRWDWAKAWDVDNFVLTRAGGKVMETTEDFLRMSLFLQYYDETVPGSAKMAADLVNAVHFDYSNLTPTETKLKSIIPFFVWTRRNLPLQIQTAVENPRYVQRYRAMLQAMNDNFGGEDPENLEEADWMTAHAAGTNYKVNENTPFWARVMIDPDLPIRDLLEIPNPEPGALVEYANNTLGPHISLISDLNAQREFGSVNAPAPFNAVLQGLAAVGMYDRTVDGDVRIPYHLRTLLETAVPFTREVADPLTGGPTDPNRQARYGITPDDGPLESGIKTVGGQLASGFGAKLTTPADARAAAYRSNAELDDIIRELRLKGEAPPIQD